MIHEKRARLLPLRSKSDSYFDLTFGLIDLILKSANQKGEARMNLTIKGIRYNPSEETRDFLDKKLKKLAFAEDFVHDLTISITRETLGQGFHLDAKLHFNWGTVKMVSQDCYELYEGIEFIADKIEACARKEKGKVIDSH